MAAHIVTALREVVDKLDAANGNKIAMLKMVRQAGDIRSWTEQLTTEEWRDLMGLCEEREVDQVRGYAKALLRRYHRVHIALGFPQTLEEWREREARETRRVKESESEFVFTGSVSDAGYGGNPPHGWFEVDIVGEDGGFGYEIASTESDGRKFLFKVREASDE